MIGRRYRAAFDRDIFTEQTKMVLFRHDEDGKTYRAKIDWVEIDRSKMLTDDDITLIIDGQSTVGQDFLTSMYMELKHIIHAKADPALEGLKAVIEAKNEYLQDLRNLLFNFECDPRSKG